MKGNSFLELLDDFVSLFFPKVCVNCNNSLVYQEELLCSHCRWTLPETNFHLSQSNTLKAKFIYEPKITHVTSFIHFHKKGVAQKLIHALKYKHRPQIGDILGEWYGGVLEDTPYQQCDLIIPVPLHRSRYAQRGYNQSAHIAKGLSKKLMIPVREDLLIRKTNSETQTKKSKLDRMINIASIFEVQQAVPLNGAHIMIVDDVLTTGATVGALADAVLAAGAASVKVVTIAAGMLK